MNINKDYQLLKPVEQGQCVWDLAIQLYGSVEELPRILSDNPEVSVNAALAENTSIRYQANPANVTDKPTMDYLRENEIIVNTHVVITDSNYLLQEDDSLLQQEDNSNILIL